MGAGVKAWINMDPAVDQLSYGNPLLHTVSPVNGLVTDAALVSLARLTRLQDVSVTCAGSSRRKAFSLQPLMEILTGPSRSSLRSLSISVADSDAHHQMLCHEFRQMAQENACRVRKAQWIRKTIELEMR